MAFKDWLTDPSKEGLPLLKDWLASFSPDVWTERQQRAYNEDPFIQRMREEQEFAQQFLGDYKTNRMAAAEEGVRRQRLAIEQQANLAGFTGTSTPGRYVSRAASDIMGGAQRDISSLGAQVDLLTEQNLGAAKTFEEAQTGALGDRWKNFIMGTMALGASAIPGLGQLGTFGASKLFAGTPDANAAALQYLQGRPDLMQTLAPYGDYGYGGGTPAYPQGWDPLYGGGYAPPPAPEPAPDFYGWPPTG